jgi:flagellar hook-associated protein 1 FlgK
MCRAAALLSMGRCAAGVRSRRQITTAFAGDATASFVDGRLTLTATNPANGVAVVQDDTTPSSIGGRGFSHFFGLNDLVDAARPSFFETGA